MKGIIQDIEGLAVGSEVRTLDQFFRVEDGSGEAVLDGNTSE